MRCPVPSPGGIEAAGRGANACWQAARDRDAALEGRRILVVETTSATSFALSSSWTQKGATIEIARNGREAIEALTRSRLPAPTPSTCPVWTHDARDGRAHGDARDSQGSRNGRSIISDSTMRPRSSVCRRRTGIRRKPLER